MGEFAIRNCDKQEVKIGTCESMYYLRYEDRFDVTPLRGNIDPAKESGLYFRLPFPDEDSVKIGEYDPYNRGERLYNKADNYAEEIFTFFDHPWEKGLIQLHHECGLLINVDCFHGTRLPEGSKEIRTGWNGKSWCLELQSLKSTPDGVLPVIGCRFCRSAYRMPWDLVLLYVHGEMKTRLEAIREKDGAKVYA